MNYKKVYKDLMKTRVALKNERTLLKKQHKKEQKGKKKKLYFEVHHIKPRALGGKDDDKNLVILTLREHFLAHYLLHKIHGGAMSYAFKWMCDFKRYKCFISSREYEKLKILFADRSSVRAKKRFEDPNQRKNLSEKQKEIWNDGSKIRKDRLKFLKSKEWGDQISVNIKNWIKNNPEKHKEKMDALNHNPEKIRKMAETHRGMKRSKASKSRMSKSKKDYFKKHGSAWIGKGCKYIHNPKTKERKRVSADSKLPKGWKWGLGKQDNQKAKGIGMFIKNEKTKKEKFILKEDKIPKGWIRGRLIINKGSPIKNVNDETKLKIECKICKKIYAYNSLERLIYSFIEHTRNHHNINREEYIKKFPQCESFLHYVKPNHHNQIKMLKIINDKKKNK